MVICLAEAVLLLLFVVRVLRTPNTEQTIPYQDLVGTTVPDDRDGWYIDSTFPQSDDGLFDSTPEQHMNPGVYEITVNYESDTYKNTTTVTATTKSYNALLAEDILMPGKLTHTTYTVWLFDETDDFQVRNYYCGEGYLIIRDITIVRTNLLERMQCVLWLFAFVILDLLVFGSIRYGSLANFLYRRRMVILLIALALVATAPDLDGGITRGDDIGFHLLRIEGLAKSFSEGIIPCKLQTNWNYGYGYAVSLFYGDLFLSIPAVLYLAGFPISYCYNFFLFLVHLASAVICYICCRKITGNRLASFACAVVYVLNPYALTGTYYRNALGETQAVAFYPLIVYGILMILTQDTDSRTFKRAWIPAVIGFTGIIESHMLSCVICAEFLALALLIGIRKVFQKKRFLMLVKTAVWTLLLNAWFIVPLLMSYHNLDINQPYKNALRIQDTGALIRDLFSWSWGSTNVSGLSELAYSAEIYSVGAACGIVFLMFLFVFIRDRSSSGKHVIPGCAMTVWVLMLLALFMSTQYFPWDNICDLLGSHAMLIVNVQFVTRYMTAAIAMLPFVMCYTLLAVKAYWKEIAMRGTAVLLALVAFLNTYPEMRKMTTQHMYDIGKFGRTDMNMAEYVYNKDVEYTADDFMEHKVDPQYDYIPGQINTGDGVSAGDYTQEKLTATVTCENTSDTDSWMELPLMYYEQYQAEDEDGNALDVEPGDINVVRVIVPAGFKGTITVRFVYPAGWIASVAVSLAALIALILKRAVRKKKAGTGIMKPGTTAAS